jgi:hypothetical protein
MKAVLCRMAPGIPAVDLFADAPVGNPRASAYLLAAYSEWFAEGTVFFAVVDPGVGGTRPPVILEADGRWYVGPCNGLFELVERRAISKRSWDIDWKPERLSASFHGRDLFAPVAAIVARGESPPGRPHQGRTDRRADWPDDLARPFTLITTADERAEGCCRATHGWSRPVDCYSVQGPLAISLRARPSGTRILTGLLKLPSIKGVLTASSVSRLAHRSKSSLE